MQEINTIQKLAERFASIIDADMELETRISFTDINEKIDLSIKAGKIETAPEIDTDKDIFFELTTEVFAKIMRKEIEAFTAAGKADIRDRAMLDWHAGPGFKYTKMNAIYAMMMFFFNYDETKTIPLGPEYSRLVHGAHAIPLFYHLGFRSAWYQVQKGEKMNSEGDTNPFDQAFIIISGTGKAKIGDNFIDLRCNRAYHIPKDSDHVVWTDSDEPLTMIWLAWGQGA
ncbi:MAG: hypothetical protein JXR38_00405 [Bacilli bacterium]|nr:hypothetical protein [Bacilli bacterium]